MQDNSDSVLAVKFYQKEVENQFLTDQNQRPIKYMADFVRIEIPGNMLSIIDTFSNDDHKQRFPIQWAQYQNSRTAEQMQGTPLHDWPLLTSAQASELRHFKFYSVEQVAGASDQQVNQVHMIVGMGGLAFRDRARAFLNTANGAAESVKREEELAKRDIEIAELKEQMAQLLAMQEPKRMGRPRKEAETT